MELNSQPFIITYKNSNIRLSRWGWEVLRQILNKFSFLRLSRKQVPRTKSTGSLHPDVEWRQQPFLRPRLSGDGSCDFVGLLFHDGNSPEAERKENVLPPVVKSSIKKKNRKYRNGQWSNGAKDLKMVSATKGSWTDRPSTLPETYVIRVSK